MRLAINEAILIVAVNVQGMPATTESGQGLHAGAVDDLFGSEDDDDMVMWSVWC